MFQVKKTNLRQQQLLIERLSPEAQKDEGLRERTKVLQMLKTPKSFTASHLAEFLSHFEDVCERHSHDYAFLFTLDATKKIDLVGMLLLYKIIVHSLSIMGLVEPHLDIPPRIQEKLDRCGMFRLINSYLRSPRDINNAYNSLHKIEQENLFIFPRRLSPSDEGHNADVKNAFLDAVSQFYMNHGLDDCCFPVGDCIGEIIGNYRAHSEDQSETVVAAQGNLDSFTLAIVDNGRGIISTLGEHVDVSQPEKVLEAAVERGTSSKKHSTNHMGYGLFHVAELAKIHKGRLTIWSEGVCLDIMPKKTSVKPCGHWQGTIIAVTLRLSKAYTIKDLPYYQERGDSGLKMNYA